MAQSFGYQTLRPPTTQKPGNPTKTTSNTVTAVNPVAFGNGIVTPFRRDGKGDFANASDISLVRSEVQQVLGTLASSGSTQGELQWRPEFGSNLQLLRFRNLDETTLELARTYTADALRIWLPRIRVKAVSADANFDDKTLTITVVYSILDANRRSVITANQTSTIIIPVAA